MFEIGWTEMLVIAVVMIVVVGPKDLPKMLRTFGKTTSKLRSMAGDFRRQFDEALREAELDDVKGVVDEARKLNPMADIRKALSPMEQAAASVRAGVDDLLKPSPPPVPAPSEAQAAEPLKVGPAEIPGEVPLAGPTEMPAAPPAFPVDTSAQPADPATHPAAPLKTAGPAEAAKPMARKPRASVKPLAPSEPVAPAAVNAVEAKKPARARAAVKAVAAKDAKPSGRKPAASKKAAAK